MADRRSVFVAPEVIEASAAFVCAADEVWRLQRGSEADCVFFQRAVNKGERITDKGTRQGTWILSPNGSLLAHVNTRNVARQLETMAKGLAAFEALPPEERVLSPDAQLVPAHRWEDSFPEAGLALVRIGRELTETGESSKRWNRDFAWFSADELEESIPSDLQEGQEFELPLIAKRLARFHLVDNVRGQTLPYAESEISRATLLAKVVSTSDERIRLHLTGDGRAEAGDDWTMGNNLWKPKRIDPHGVEWKLVGTAEWDSKSSRFDSFEVVALANHWGKTVMNGRGRDASPGQLAFHLTLTDRQIAPAFIAVYDAPWVAMPAVPTWRESPEECGLEAE